MDFGGAFDDVVEAVKGEDRDAAKDGEMECAFTCMSFSHGVKFSEEGTDSDRFSGEG